METATKIIAIRKKDGFIFINQSDIVHCDMEGRKVIIFMKDGAKYFVSSTIKKFFNRLDNSQFTMVFSAYILNKAFVSEVLINEEGAYVILKDKTKIPLNRNKKMKLVKFMSDFIIDGNTYTVKEKAAE